MRISGFRVLGCLGGLGLRADKEADEIGAFMVRRGFWVYGFLWLYG